MLQNDTERRALDTDDERFPAEGPGILGYMEGLEQDVRAVLHAERQHVILTATTKAADLMSRALHAIIVMGLVGVSVLFLAIALSVYLGQLLDAPAVGYGIVAGMLVVLLAVHQLLWSHGGRERAFLRFMNYLHRDA